MRRRLRHRHAGQQGVLDWHLHRSGELDGVLRAAHAEDVTVDATGLTVPQVTADAAPATGAPRPGRCPVRAARPDRVEWCAQR